MTKVVKLDYNQPPWKIEGREIAKQLRDLLKTFLASDDVSEFTARHELPLLVSSISFKGKRHKRAPGTTTEVDHITPVSFRVVITSPPNG